MPGYDVTNMEQVSERALEFRNEGYSTQKWFIRHGPEIGPEIDHEGIHLNVALVRALRERLGEDYVIMIEGWQSLNFDYAVDFATELKTSGRAGSRNLSGRIGLIRKSG